MSVKNLKFIYRLLHAVKSLIENSSQDTIVKINFNLTRKIRIAEY